MDSEHNDKLELIFLFDSENEIVMNQVIDLTSSTFKYQEVRLSKADIISKTAQASLPILSLREISKLAPNGIFTTIADSKVLSKFGDGTFSTMIRKNGKIAQNVGFEKIGIQYVNPFTAINIAMQAMSLVSGQYYLHQINSKLDGQMKILNELVDFKHLENKSTIRSVIKEFTRITNKVINEPIDFQDLHRIHSDVDKVYEFYYGLYEQAYNEVFKILSEESKKNKSSNNLGLNMKFNKKKQNKNNEVFQTKLSELNKLYLTCHEISKIILQVLLAEISVSINLSKDTQVIDGLKHQMNNFYLESFYSQQHEELYLNLIKHSSSLDESNSIVQIIKNQYPSLKESIFKDPMIEASKQFMLDDNQTTEVLYLPSEINGQARAFVAII